MIIMILQLPPSASSALRANGESTEISCQLSMKVENKLRKR